MDRNTTATTPAASESVRLEYAALYDGDGAPLIICADGFTEEMEKPLTDAARAAVLNATAPQGKKRGNHHGKKKH